MKCSFFQAAVVSILLYGCTTWTLTKRREKRLGGNYIRMLRAILNKSWRQHPTKHQLFGHLLPITKTIQVRRTRHAGHCWRSMDELISDVLLWTPNMVEEKLDDQLEHTYNSYVRIRDVALKTYQRWWTIGRSGERGSGISVLAARHDDDDDDLLEIELFWYLNCLLMINWNAWNMFLHVNCVLMLNWIVWNRIVLTFNCVSTKTILILYWNVWIRTIWLNWIA